MPARSAVRGAAGIEIDYHKRLFLEWMRLTVELMRMLKQPKAVAHDDRLGEKPWREFSGPGLRCEHPRRGSTEAQRSWQDSASLAFDQSPVAITHLALSSRTPTG